MSKRILLQLILFEFLVGCDSTGRIGTVEDLERCVRADFYDFSVAIAEFYEIENRLPLRLWELRLKSIHTPLNRDWFYLPSVNCQNSYGYYSISNSWVIMSFGPDLLANTEDDIVIFGGQIDSLLNNDLISGATASVTCVESSWDSW